MGYQIKDNLTTVNYRSRGTKPTWIVIHNTENHTSKEGTAYANTQYFKSTLRNASANYFIDDGDTVWCCVKPTDTAWHCGEAASKNGCYNYNSIGIEVCETDAGNFTNHEIQVLAWLVQKLMKEYGISADHVCRHHDVTGKNCPRGYINNSTWAKLKKAITETTKPDAWDVQMWTPNTNAQQRFNIKWQGDWFTLQCVADGRYLDVQGAGKDNGTKVQVYTGNGTDAQLWKAVPVGDFYKPVYSTPVYLVPKCAPGMALDIKSKADENGAALQLWSRHDGLNQQWNMLDLGSGVVTLITNLGSHKAIDVKGGGK